ncbi:hypothetical protein DENSPDRAFT_866262 [Dentipellis sp. KUC8613]|nr:hypothetical protein DENSPDRAFT_866262 [Dentipellis sp. KUC8613]
MATFNWRNVDLNAIHNVILRPWLPEVKPRVLLVSAFFPLPKSKHTFGEYEAWLTHYLQPITSDLYMFAPPEMEEMIRRLRGDLPMTLNTTYHTIWDIPTLRGRKDLYYEMHTWDPEQWLHSPELYAVWTGKVFFLDEGFTNSLAAGKHYDYAFWNDAGSMRESHTYRNWPDGKRVDEVYRASAKLSGVPIDQMVFFGLWWAPDKDHKESKEWREERGPVEWMMSEGSFFGGMLDAVRTYRHLYMAYHDHYLARSFFVGKDQSIMNVLLFLFPSHFTVTWVYDSIARQEMGIPDGAETQLGNCGSSWFYYQWYFAEPSEREEQADAWYAEENAHRAGGEPIKERCHMQRLMTFDMFMKRAYGNDWVPPPASVDIVGEGLRWLDHP